MLSPSRRPKKCKQCKASFVPNNPLQVVCSPLCALEYAKKKRIKEEVKEIRDRKQAIKTLPDFKKEAEQACHAYVRARDEGKPCISCGTILTSEGIGGGFDAGHYRSRGAADHLRYDHARNIFGQCKRCNRYLGGNVLQCVSEWLAELGSSKLRRWSPTTPRTNGRVTSLSG